MKKILLPFIGICFWGCASHPEAQLFFNSETKMSGDVPFTIQVSHEDAGGIRQELQILLQQSGYQIHSTIAGKKTTTLNQEKRFTEINSLDESQVYTQQEFQKYGTTNMLTISYRVMGDGNGNILGDNAGNVFVASFFAEIANSKTGTILMSMRYPEKQGGYYRKSELLKDFVRRLNLCVKENKCDEESQKDPPNFAAVLGLVFAASVAVIIFSGD